MGTTLCKEPPPPLFFQIGVAEQSTSNAIKTTNYNIFTFLPLATLIQFKRVANVYFLITAILQFIPIISPLSPISAIAPLLFVLSVSLIRSGIEEYGKYKFDKESNASQFEVYDWESSESEDNWQIKRSDELKVGNIIKINEDRRLPADLILLGSANPDGKCYLETGSLDGEKNLKNRMVLNNTQSLFYNQIYKSKDKLINSPFITIEEPNEQLYTFNGQLEIEENRKNSVNQFLKINQFLYRDSVLRNTKNIVGVIVYAGKDTKTMLNNSQSREKMSSLEKKVNFYMIFIFILQVCLLTLCAILRIVLYYSTQNGKIFIEEVERQSLRNNGEEGAITAATYFILLNTMIPISLLVSIQIVKFAQGIFITFDMFLKSGETSARAFRSSINEQLGMVEYVFTDKTGTLTRNQMVLTKIVIGDRLFEAEKSSNSQLFNNSQLKSQLQNNLSFLNDLKEGLSLPQKKQNSLMLLLMSTCHECLRTQKGEYHGTSPDQITLVGSASNLDYIFMQNSFGTLNLKIKGKKQSLKLDELFEFDSDRKRMSVILSHESLGEDRILLCKGADNIIEKRLTKKYFSSEKQAQQYKSVQKYVNQFSVVGLRTLLFGYRIIKKNQYTSFKEKMNSLNQSQKQQISKLIDNIQQQLSLIGASGVEDKLQDQVQNVIFDMIRANIKVCMLTGDKLQTAQNIAKSCKLFHENDEIIKITETSAEGELFEGYCHGKKLTESGKKFVILVEGSALPNIIDTLYFLYLLENCSAGVCCRITPKNKAEMVLLAKKQLKKLTLSIGDGANDVPMIMAANIGIGLYGNEGMNAVQASDFAIPQFKGLWRLLFVHGRWNYNRIAQLIKYFFYKNMVFTLAQLWFAYFCNFSGSSIYDAFYLALYNTIFTGGPVLVRALFEQDVNYVQILSKNENEEDQNENTAREKLIEEDKLAIKVRIDPIMKHLFPLLYSHTQQQLSFTPRIFALVILESTVESVAVFALIYFGIETSEYWIFSISLFSVVLALVTIRICYDIIYWTWLMVLTILFTSILPYILFMYIMSLVEFQLSGTFQQIFAIPDFYLLILLAIGVGALIQGTFSLVNKYYFPTVVEFARKEAKIIKERRKNGEFELEDMKLN